MKQIFLRYTKAVILISVFVIVGTSVKAQLKIGAHLGVPVGDISDFSSVAIGADAYYMFGANPNGFLKLGAASGFASYFIDDTDENVQYVPVAGALRVQLLKIITVGPDIGYAFGVSDGMDNGFYWKGVVGVNLFDFLEVDAYFDGMSIDEDSSFGSVGLGVLFEF